jgi:hypothetical protein
MESVRHAPHARSICATKTWQEEQETNRMPSKRIIDALEIGCSVAALGVYLPPALLNKEHHLLHEVVGYGLPPKSLFGNGM